MIGLILRKFSKLYPIQLIRWVKVWKSFPIGDWIKGAKYFRSGDYRTAAKFYLNGLAKHNNHKAAHCASLDLAFCQLKLGNLLESQAILKGLVSQNTKLKQAYLMLSQLYRYQGNFFSAVNVTSQGLQQYPGSGDIIAAHAHTCFEMPHFVSLIEEAKALLDLYYRTGNQNEEEERLIETAIADFEIRYGDSAEGEKILSRILSAGNAPFEATLLKGKLLLDGKRNDQARNLILKAQKKLPDNPLPSAYLAISYLDDQEPIWALEHAREACALSNWTNIFCLKVMIDCINAVGDDGSLDLFEAKLDKLVLEEELNVRKIRVLSDPLSITRELANNN